MCVCVCLWTPESDAFFNDLPHFETGSIPEPGDHCVDYSVWPSISGDPLVSS